MAGKNAVVSGGTGGIGSAVVRQLLDRGDNVEAWYLKNTEKAHDLQVQAKGKAGKLTTRVVDVSDPDAVSDAMSGISRLDLFVHSAGAINRPGEWDLATVEATRQTIEVNLTSALWVARAAAPIMRRQGSGHLMFLSSAYAIGAGAGAVLAYTAAKAGLTAVTRGLAAELGADGVRVNAVAPSNVDTPMTHSAGAGVVDWAISTTPVGRLAEPDEIAQLILAMDENAYMTGNIVIIDGGQTLKI